MLITQEAAQTASVADINAAIAMLNEIVETRKLAEFETLKAKYLEMAKAAGLSAEMEAIFNGKARHGSAGKTVAPKYRNPKNATETWTGRGHRPRWAAGMTGAQLQACLIEKAPEAAAVPEQAPAALPVAPVQPVAQPVKNGKAKAS